MSAHGSRAQRAALPGPAVLLAVGVFGALGTAAREAISLAVPKLDGLPVAILGINLLGAFCLGVLLEALLRRGPDAGRRRAIRLALGTGLLGGFTTYSTLATDAASLLLHGAGWLGIGYALGSVLLGAAASFLGILLGARAPRSRRPQRADAA